MSNGRTLPADKVNGRGARLFQSAVIKKLWLAALLLCITPFLLITPFNHPFYDDYCHAAKTLEYGVLGAVKNMYLTWNGKYFSTLLLSFHPLVFGSFNTYKIVPLILILLTWLSIYFSASALLKGEVASVDKLIAATLFTALFMNQIPELTEGYYWMPGSVTYLVGDVLTIFFFGIAVRLFESRGKGRSLLLILNCLLIVAIMGSSETIMMIFFLLLLAMTIKAFISRDDSKRVWLAFLLVAALCAAVVTLAPGNAVRSGNGTRGHLLFSSLIYSCAQELRFLLKWLTNPALILGTILFIPVAYRLSESNERFKRHFNFHPLAASLLLLLVLFMGFFPAYWNLGMLGQHRTVNLVFFLFLVGWFLNLAIWTGYLNRKFGVKVAAPPRYVYVICLLLIPLSLLTTSNTIETIGDLASGRAFRYDVQMKRRYAQIEECLKTGRSPCTIDRLTDLPTSITSAYIDAQLSCDESYWKIKLMRADAK